MREAGYRTALYTSPHLHTFRERIRVNGEMIPAADMARIVERMQAVVERIKALGDPSIVPTTYELDHRHRLSSTSRSRASSMASSKLGLGGRLDATKRCYTAGVCDNVHQPGPHGGAGRHAR